MASWHYYSVAKKIRKFAGGAAAVGGAALVGGLAYSAVKNWKKSKTKTSNNISETQARDYGLLEAVNPALDFPEKFNSQFELLLVKVMISAAYSDGHIDADEEERILHGIEQLNFSEDAKVTFMDLVRYPDSPENLAREVSSIKEKSELYLMACFAIDIDSPEERTFLGRLSNALNLPDGLPEQLQQQANEIPLQAA